MTPHRITLLARAVGLAALAAGPAFAQAAKPDCSATAADTAQLPVMVPIELRNNHVAFWVCRGDRPLNFVLDTGAGTSIFDMGAARSIGVELGTPFRASGGGAGFAAGAQIRGDTVRLPGTTVNALITQAIDFSGISGPEGATMQGILGADFMA